MSCTIKNLLLALLFLAFFLFIGGKMRTGLSFGEVVGFEFSYFPQPHTADCVATWKTATLPNGLTKLEALKANTRFDFLYIIGYVFFGVFLARVAAGQSRPHIAKKVGVIMVIAGLCDVVENLQLLQIIEGNLGLRPMLMSIFAGLKFGLLAVALGWAVALFAKR